MRIRPIFFGWFDDAIGRELQKETESIFHGLETAVFGIWKIFSAIVTMFFVIETTFSATESIFSVIEKTVGEAPTTVSVTVTNNT